ncbi:HDOD domain-containing protein [Marinobacter caseinilyticus]|uniref:HDOD domain-containing protein n=1 Tax=Marinobacter caseinilyticus TaxID=2692195 RepID=UPI00140B43C4|nr:HDOD domain-containing protein [Marinobacter caseinilyticus]
MRILILEDDLLVGQLLETIVSGLYPRHRISSVAGVGDAMAVWRVNHFDLLICDWNLPDGSGLDFIKHVRAQDQALPIVMVTGRTDRQSVLAAAHYRVSGFISKPFSVEMVHQKLAQVLPATPLDLDSEPVLDAFLRTASEHGIQLPTSVSTAEVLALQARDTELSAAQLAERWCNETGLVTKMLDVANSSSFRRSGEPVRTLRDAIQVLGIRTCLDQALGLSLQLGGALQDQRLRDRESTYSTLAEKTAQQARLLATKLHLDGRLCFTAGLLSRAGELATLHVLQQFVSAGGELSEEDIQQALNAWAAPLGNTLKVQWKLPLELRSLTGAVHALPAGSVKQAFVMMRAAALLATDSSPSAECQKLLRRIGLDPALYAPNDDTTAAPDAAPNA